MEGFWDILKESLVITLVVVGLMALIELFDFHTKGRLVRRFRGSRLGQVLLAAALGVTPGCVGGYAVVSMYSQRVVGFGGLLAMMIATTGDEAFLMLTQFPKTALLIFAGLFVLAVIIGLAASRKDCRNNTDATLPVTPEGTAERTLGDRMLHLLPHAAKVFAWTFGVMLIVHLAQGYVDLQGWIGDNIPLMIILAVVVGLIPQSGPHMVFVTFYASGLITLPVLLASCLMQDGHAGLPLIAQSRRAFFIVKAQKAVLSLAVAFAFYLFL